MSRINLDLALVLSLLAGNVPGLTGVSSAATDTNPQFELTRNDLNFILKQINLSETHAEAEITNDSDYSLLCADPNDTSGTCVPDPRLPWGLRTVDGSFNNLIEGQIKKHAYPGDHGTKGPDRGSETLTAVG